MTQDTPKFTPQQEAYAKALEDHACEMAYATAIGITMNATAFSGNERVQEALAVACMIQMVATYVMSARQTRADRMDTVLHFTDGIRSALDEAMNRPL